MHELPRRYGYVPYTLLLMVIVALTAEPSLRRAVSAAPTAVIAAALSFWIALELFCLPLIRAQDRLVIDAIQRAVAATPNASLLFVNAWDKETRVPGYKLSGATPGLRGGLSFPEVFESPFTAYWTENAFAVGVLGIPHAGYRMEDVDADNVRLYDRYVDPKSAVVPAASLIVVVNTAPVQPPWKHALSGVIVAPWRSAATRHRLEK
jgi:hypothetical protein